MVAAQAITHHTTDHHWAHAAPLPIIITAVALIDMAQQMCRADVQVKLQMVEVWAILAQPPPTLVVHRRRSPLRHLLSAMVVQATPLNRLHDLRMKPALPHAATNAHLRHQTGAEAAVVAAIQAEVTLEATLVGDSLEVEAVVANLFLTTIMQNI